ncbi:unnamed protein product [Cyprideis torosa]|uniref:uridine/cytidine kinase n=1 Tax=Cyprideis torosa TaxID=163714 RepID=A0A7R8ZLM8_9CRUS|nr:unnamed protein product [Cyprideis torosa]CAG0892205.1 unnamed protein product [Cyprideis torosa]
MAHFNGVGVASSLATLGVREPFLIGVAGGTASGKTTVCQKIVTRLGQQNIDQSKRQVVVVNQDSFYRDLTEKESRLAHKGQFNFDHPSAFDWELTMDVMRKIKAGERCQLPSYDYVNHCRREEWREIHPADVVLVEGILVLFTKELRDMFQVKIFVDTDSDTRLARRVYRDINERKRRLCPVLNQYLLLVKPAFEEFCYPTKKFADVVVPRGAENEVALLLVEQQIRQLLRERREEKKLIEAALTSGRRSEDLDLATLRPLSTSLFDLDAFTLSRMRHAQTAPDRRGSLREEETGARIGRQRSLPPGDTPPGKSNTRQRRKTTDVDGKEIHVDAKNV